MTSGFELRAHCRRRKTTALLAGASLLALTLGSCPAAAQSRLFWDGGDPAVHGNNAVDGGSGTWTAGQGSNWTDQSGASISGFSPNPGFAVFQGSPGIVTIDGGQGAVGVTGMEFAVDGYRILGAPLALRSANGATVVSVGDGSAAARSMTATIAAAVSGNSRLVKEGPGTLELAGTNTFSGGTTIAGGTVRLLNERALGSGPITMSDATTLSFAASTWRTLGAVRIDGDVTFNVEQYRDAALNRDVSGPGGFTKTGLGTLSLYGDNSFDGDIHVKQGRLWVDNWAGQANRAIRDDARVTVDAGAVLSFQKGETIGALTGAGLVDITYAGDVGLTVANLDDVTFAGNISGGDPARPGFPQSYRFTKARTGKLFLTGNSDSQAAFLVNGGALVVDGSIASGLVDVGGGSLSGHGNIAGAVQVYGGTLEGRSGQTLTIGGGLSLASASRIDASLGTAGSAALFSIGGNLILDGRLNISDAGGFGAGVYQLLTYGGTLTDRGLEIGAIPAGVTAGDLSVQTAVAGQINLVSSTGATLGFWDGGNRAFHGNGRVDGGSGDWLADDSNWTEQTGVINGRFKPLPTFAIFQGARGVVTVDDRAGAVSATGMQFSTDGYRIEGSAIDLQGADGRSIIRVGNGSLSGTGTVATIASALSGSTSLVKDDYGTLILEGTNSYSGGTAVRGGTLQVSRDDNLGAAASRLSLSGGTLKTTASFGTARAITLAGTGVFDVAGGANLSLQGAISGTGDLVKEGSGTLTLAGTGSYRNSLVGAGTLVGDASSIAGNIGNAAIMVFDQSAAGVFAGDILGLNGTSGVMFKRGTGDLTLTGKSSLDWRLEAGSLASSADRFAGNVSIAPGAAFILGQTSDGSYSGAISGIGRLLKQGVGVLRLTGDSSGFAGSTLVETGVLSVDGKLGGTVDVLAGARLQGNGTVGRLTVAGLIAPGNSIGTLNVGGDVTLAAGSTYEVEIGGNGSSDRIAAGGKAALGGAKVGVTALDAKTSYQDGQSYTILTAAGGITGSFDPAVLSRSAFLDATLAQSANAVDLKIAVKETGPVFDKAANTDNQKQTAGALDTLQQSGASLALYNTLLVLSADEARAAFDSLSGEVHAATVTGLIEDSRFTRDAINERLRSAFETVGGVPLMGYGEDAKEITTASVASERYGAWGSVFGSGGHFGGDGNAARLSRSTGGFVTGVDGLITDDVRLGFMAGYSHSSFKVNDRRSSASSDNYHLGLYGGTQLGAFSLRSGLAYTWSEIDSSREVAFPGFSDSLTGSYRAGTTQVFGELGYSLKAGSVALEPFANLTYVNVHTNGFAEQGGASALTVQSGSNDSTFTTLGLRASTGFDIGSTKATARGMIGWRHAYGDLTPTVRQTFTGSNAFTIASAPIAEDAAVIEAGLDFAITPKATLGLSYHSQVASKLLDHGVRADLNVQF
ncbi:MAG TPA: autotransporter domain-containing protein [Mesorhizobium sp.]|jgi:outer membrane autotransporter protein|uniref:autotransporter domain-containing protein n=1 Tax=Mesorhizobium sp. TaxID=1871066 RepID=UPI002DDCAF9F|nr:autotransporter domain-containing protein [Mesorhizobium sp.]HEV2503731.1 autotransporter domain-containing protein [Mesorhizobium sp.]